MGYMTPEEQQGVLVTIGLQACQIHALQDVIVSLQENNAALATRVQELEHDALSHDTSEMVYGDIGASDQDPGVSSNGSSGESGDSGGDSQVLPEPSGLQQSLGSQVLRPRNSG